MKTITLHVSPETLQAVKTHAENIRKTIEDMHATRYRQMEMFALASGTTVDEIVRENPDDQAEFERVIDYLERMCRILHDVLFATQQAPEEPES